jgi:hypothetical protein
MTEHELKDAMKEHFGTFGETCYWLCRIRKRDDEVSDNQIGESFDLLVGHHRKCFNRNAYIASCREPN